jgi:phospho-N-acetylmuramoyl-pentapeptide-transferase
MACALLGFADDYTKIIKRRSLGLRARTKLGITVAISVALWWIATREANLPETLRFRLIDYQVDLSILGGSRTCCSSTSWSRGRRARST